MQNVYKTFQERIPKNSLGFDVLNPNKYKDGISRNFHIEYMHIVPEYFSMLASQNNLDDEDLNPIITRHLLKFEFNFYKNFYPLNLFEHNLIEGQGTVHAVLDTLNKVAESARPNSMQYPPIIFDWVDEYLRYRKLSRKIINKYLAENYMVLYKVVEEAENMDLDQTIEEVEPKSTFTRETHDNILPDAARRMPFANNYLFPDNPDVIEYTRVRIIVAPNTRISFSNEALLVSLGFVNYGKRGIHNRFHIENRDEEKFMVLVSDLAPPTDLIIKLDKSCKLYISLIRDLVSFTKTLTTTKYRERKPELLLKDVQDLLKTVSQNCFFSFTISFTAKKFTFTIVHNQFVATKIYLPDSLKDQLGFDNGEVTSTNRMSKDVDPEHLDTIKYVGLSKILTYDTCHAIVTLANVATISNYGYPEQLVATLVPKDEMLKIIKSVHPTFLLPEHDTHLHFRIYRQAENGKMIPLGWPIDCYVFGVVVGKPING